MKRSHRQRCSSRGARLASGSRSRTAEPLGRQSAARGLCAPSNFRPQPVTGPPVTVSIIRSRHRIRRVWRIAAHGAGLERFRASVGGDRPSLRRFLCGHVRSPPALADDFGLSVSTAAVLARLSLTPSAARDEQHERRLLVSESLHRWADVTGCVGPSTSPPFAAVRTSSDNAKPQEGTGCLRYPGPNPAASARPHFSTGCVISRRRRVELWLGDPAAAERSP